MENNKKSRPARRSPVPKNRRLQGQYLSWLLLGLIAVFLVLNLITPDREYSETENRKLAQMPAFSFSALADGSYFSGLGNYIADQFAGRDFWISLNLGFSQITGAREAGGVYLCADNYLMEIPGEPNHPSVQRNLEAINAFAAGHKNLRVYMTVVPNAVTVHADKLPANAPCRDQIADITGIKNTLVGVEFLDVTDALLAHSEEMLFYRTDHHWTSLGAKYAFDFMAPRMGIEQTVADYTVYTVSNSFEGTLSSKSGSHAVRDTVDIYVPTTGIEYYVTYANDQSNICSLYVRSALDQKDHYTVFFGGNHGRLDITTTANTGRSLLIFKDSYANCFIQFLYPYFDHITMIDPRYYYDNVETVIRSEAVTDVLFLYNANTFLCDTALADVLVTNG